MKKKYCHSLSLLLLLIIGFQIEGFAQNDRYRSVLIEKKLIQGEPFESKQFSVNRPTELSIFTLSGNIEVFENPSIDYIQVDLYVDRGFSLWSGGANLDNYRIIFQKQPGKVVASVEPKRSESRVWKGENISFSYVVQVPVNVSSRIRNTKGDIYARNLNGSHLIQATVGNLFLDGLDGETNAYSASGNITAENMKGEFNAKTTNGNISLWRADGETRLRTVTGSISSRGVNGTFIAATTTGNVNATLISVGKGSYIETVTGSVSLTLPRDMDYAIEASGSSVDISDLLDRGEFEGNVQRRSAKVVFGTGAIPIQITSVSGNVTVKTVRN